LVGLKLPELGDWGGPLPRCFVEPTVNDDCAVSPRRSSYRRRSGVHRGAGPLRSYGRGNSDHDQYDIRNDIRTTARERRWRHAKTVRVSGIGDSLMGAGLRLRVGCRKRTWGLHRRRAREASRCISRGTRRTQRRQARFQMASRAPRSACALHVLTNRAVPIDAAVGR